MWTFNNSSPVFLQLATSIEDSILSGEFCEETRLPSAKEFSESLNISPATALKGMGLLLENGVVFKKRGIGMFVRQGAKRLIAARRRREFANTHLLPVLHEAKKLGMTKSDLAVLLEATPYI